MRWNPLDFWNRGFSNCGNQGYTPRHFKNVTIENNLFLNGRGGEAKGGGLGQFIANTNAESVGETPSCQHWPWYDPSCSNATNGDCGYLRVNNNVAEIYVLNPTHEAWADQYTGNCSNCFGINLTDEANHDYTPTTASEALIDRGSGEHAPSYDIRGQVRPSGTGVDVGAYEFASSVVGDVAGASGSGEAAGAAGVPSFSGSPAPSGEETVGCSCRAVGNHQGSDGADGAWFTMLTALVWWFGRRRRSSRGHWAGSI
jgi:hypothetical protein